LCSFLLIATSYAQSKKLIKELKVKNCTETTTLYENGKESTFKSGYKVFDKDGNTIENTEYNTDGSVKRKETTKYSGKNKTEEIVDDRGDKESDASSGGKKYKKTTWKYDKDGDEIEQVDYDEKGNVLKKTTYAYNKNKDKLYEVVYDGKGTLIKKIAYGYDAKGLKISKTTYGPGDVVLKVVKYTYGY
jgi:antitoxin component YwqK of YwqJK toxin-antitoxin module